MRSWDLRVSRVMVVNEPAWMLSSAWRRRVICWSPCMRNVGLTFFLTLTYYFAHWKSPVWTGLLNICILFPELLQSSRVAYLGKCITSHTPLPHFLEERKATKWQAGSKLSYWAKNCMWINRWKGGKVPFCLTSDWADFEDIKTSRQWDLGISTLRSYTLKWRGSESDVLSGPIWALNLILLTSAYDSDPYHEGQEWRK